MKSYKQISNKHLLKKKRHFFLTLLGIIMSVALVTAMMTLMYSLVENLKDNSISSAGTHHIAIGNLSINEVNAIKARAEVDQSGTVLTLLSGSLGEYSEELAQYHMNNNKIIDILAYDENALNMLPAKLSSGTYPSNSTEIIVDQLFIQNYKDSVSVGSVVTFDVGTVSVPLNIFNTVDTASYTVSGILDGEINISSGLHGQVITMLDNTFDNSLAPYKSFLRIKESYNIHDFANTIESITAAPEIEFHTSLMALEGRDGDTGVLGPVYTIGTFLAVIIILATIAVIYNSFNMSVLDKVSLYGLLRASGATRKQIKRIVLREAVLYSIIGVPIGTLLGLGVTYILLEFVGFEPFNLTGSGLTTYLSPGIALAGSVIGLATTMLSSMIPASKASKISPIEAITGKNETVLEKPDSYKKKTLVGKIFGFPGTMAIKNLRRNKRKFRVTVFSIIVSSILFIVFNSMVIMSMDINPYVSMGFDYGIINTDYIQSAFSQADLTKLRDISGVNRIYQQNEVFVSTSEEPIYNLRVVAIGNDILAEYFNGILPTRMTEENRCIIIAKWDTPSSNPGFSLGDKLEIDIPDSDMVRQVLAVERIDNEYPIPNSNLNALIALVSEETMDRIHPQNRITALYVDTSDDADKRVINNALISMISEKPWFRIVDLSEEELQNKRFTAQLYIFFYGFLGVIILIGSLNIINTVNTSLIQRKREFAILGSIGMTRKQLSQMVILETLIQGLRAGIIGCIIGTGLVFVLYELFGNISGVDNGLFEIPFGALAITLVASITISLLSSISPMKKIRNQDIIKSLNSLE